MPAPAARLTRLDPVTIGPGLTDPDNVSGIGFVGDFMLLVCDETAQVDVLKRTAAGYAVLPPIKLGKRGEYDLESVATTGTTVYAVGAHSRVRSRIKPDDTYADAQAKMTKIKDNDGKRDVLVRFTLAADGTAVGLERTSLRAAIEASEVLEPFAGLPGKENGVDVEGLAVRGDVLFAGFRGPVLRDNYVPVMRIKFGKDRGEVLFVTLGGRGVRDLVAVGDGLLILAGPVGDGPGGYQIYHWNGHDCLPKANPAGACVWLCDIVPAVAGAKPEGLAVRAEDEDGWEFVLVCDTAANGGATAYRLDRKA